METFVCLKLIFVGGINEDGQKPHGRKSAKQKQDLHTRTIIISTITPLQTETVMTTETVCLILGCLKESASLSGPGFSTAHSHLLFLLHPMGAWK